jgi:hypothetical protein
MTRRTIECITIAAAVLAFGAAANAHAELLEYDDSTSNMIAASHVASSNATGWNDPTLYTGDILGLRYHIFVVIKDTVQLKSLFDEHQLDSAALSVVIGGVTGSPGALNLHGIRRDSTGVGIYPAYDDSRTYYCRSEWRGRKSAHPDACPDSILWETPGATGTTDYNPVPFAGLESPQAGQRHDINITSWIAGIIEGADTVSNGIMLLAANEDGSGSDYITIRHIHPFFAGDDRMILKIWRSPLAYAPPRRAWIDSPYMLK